VLNEHINVKCLQHFHSFSCDLLHISVLLTHVVCKCQCTTRIHLIGHDNVSSTSSKRAGALKWEPPHPRGTSKESWTFLKSLSKRAKLFVVELNMKLDKFSEQSCKDNCASLHRVMVSSREWVYKSVLSSMSTLFCSN